MTQIKEIYLDMDGVIANFVQGAIDAHGEWDETLHNDVRSWNWFETDWNIDAATFWAPLNNREFWLSLDVYQHVEQLMTMLSARFPGVKITFCTTPSRLEECVPAKMTWLQEKGFLNSGEFRTRFLAMAEKERLAKPGVLLIDDSDENVRNFREAGGKAALFPQTWNADRDFVHRRISRLVENVDAELSTGVAAARHNLGKPELSQLLHFRLDALAAHCNAGREKYPDVNGQPNWKLGGKPDAEYLDAATRHLKKLVEGIVYDEETGTMHAAAVAWNMHAMITNNYANEPVRKELAV